MTDSAAPLTPLDQIIRDRIARNGSIAVYDFMRLALTHHDHGYYRTRPAIGAAGDFVTAPEISQTFGEILGLWSAVTAETIAPGEPLALIEIGPGRGTLMADALRALKVVPRLLSRLSVHLVEPSPALQAVQRHTLADAAVEPHWHEKLDTVPQGAAVILANEVVDALPVRQLVRQQGVWHEREVGLAADGALGFLTGARVSEETLPPAEDGEILELRPDTEAFLAPIATRSRSHPTVALLIDYGHDRTGPGDTLQAVRNHRHSDPLEHAGAADLTAQVDFEALANAARGLGLAVDGPTPQATFLGALGIAERAKRLMRGSPPSQAATIEAGVSRLIDPSGMGSRFKVLGLHAIGLPRLPGF